MVVLMTADNGPTWARDDEIAAWAEVRPAPVCRTPEEVAEVRSAVEWLRASGDRRLRFLAQGLESALDWATGASVWAPVLDVRRPRPNLRELAGVISEAGQVAAGLVPMPGQRLSDAGRITGRGVQEMLAWWTLPAYPAPAWLDGGAAPAAFAALVLGAVGADPARLTALASSASFPNDVADRAT
jgi:hypothetical protein